MRRDDPLMQTYRLFTAAAAAIALAILAGCATPTPYQPLEDGEGYENQQLEAQRYRVTFIGNSVTERDTVENYLLYRAAEITVESGHDLFTVVERDVEPITRYIGSVSLGTGYWGFWDPFGFGVSTSTANPVTKYRATMTVVVSDGDKPPGAVETYDARDVMQQLKPLVRLPDEASEAEEIESG